MVGDANLVAGNIKKGVNIFGITGTADDFSGDMKYIILNGDFQVPVSQLARGTYKGSTASIPNWVGAAPWKENNAVVFASWGYMDNKKNQNDAYGYAVFTFPVQANRFMTFHVDISNCTYASGSSYNGPPWECGSLGVTFSQPDTLSWIGGVSVSYLSRATPNPGGHYSRKSSKAISESNIKARASMSVGCPRTSSLGAAFTYTWVQNAWIEYSNS